MNPFGFLAFLADPRFVAAWYGFGLMAAGWVLHDTFTANQHVMPAMKAAWPIIVLFFSPIGLALYLWSCRPSQIGRIQRQSSARTKEVHTAFVSRTWKKVVGSDIHCVGGDGLGIMSAMVVSRLAGLRFWNEFWIEYAAGFAFGWFFFQAPAMRRMENSWAAAILNGGRAEFFSMIAVMLGMGLVMRFVTPAVVGHRPSPDTAAFWVSAHWACWRGLSSPIPSIGVW